MKREHNDLDLRNAFRPMPEKCRQALQNAANTVKEEQPMKRASIRAALIAAIIIVAMMGIALAAQQLGWVDFYAGYDRMTVPQTAADALNSTRAQSFAVGPMTFTVKQLLGDGRIVMGSTEIHTTDGSNAVYAADCNDLTDPVDAGSDTSLAHYGLTPGVSWLEVAQQTGHPLYRLRATIEVTPENDAGVAMEDAMWNTDGSIVYFSMPFTLPETMGESLSATIYMNVVRCDPETGDEMERWTDRQPIAIPVSPLLSEKTYLPDGSADLNGIRLTSIHAEQYATGIYLTSTFTLPDGMDADTAVEALYSLRLCDQNGDELPMGLSLSGEANIDHLPTATLETMTSVETLPQRLIVTDGEAKVVVE